MPKPIDRIEQKYDLILEVDLDQVKDIIPAFSSIPNQSTLSGVAVQGKNIILKFTIGSPSNAAT